MPLQLHYVKSVQIRSFFWSGVFSRIRTEYGYLSVFGTVKNSYFISFKVLSNVNSLEQVTRLSVPATIQFFHAHAMQFSCMKLLFLGPVTFSLQQSCFFFERKSHCTWRRFAHLSYLICFVSFCTSVIAAQVHLISLLLDKE